MCDSWGLLYTSIRVRGIVSLRPWALLQFLAATTIFVDCVSELAMEALGPALPPTVPLPLDPAALVEACHSSGSLLCLDFPAGLSFGCDGHVWTGASVLVVPHHSDSARASASASASTVLQATAATPPCTVATTIASPIAFLPACFPTHTTSAPSRPTRHTYTRTLAHLTLHRPPTSCNPCPPKWVRTSKA